MNWDLADYVVALLLLGSVGFALVLTLRSTRNAAYRAAMGIALIAALLLVWINGAVGIIGSENNDANMMFAGVIAVGLAGALIARLRPPGMARAMYATALVQVLVAVVALLGQLGTDGAAWPRDVIFVTLFFAALWLLSGGLFRRAASG
jgi:hypothetical protein